MSKTMTPLFDKNGTRPEGEVVSDSIDSDVEQYVDEDTGEVVETRRPWTIISALNRVLELAQDSKLSDEFWQKAQSPIDFLGRTLGLSKMQVVFLSIMVEDGDPMTWRGFGKYLECPRLSVMAYSDELEDLVAKRWVYRCGTHEMGSMRDAFALVYGVVKALRHNSPFVPEKIDGLTMQEFVDKMENHLNKTIGNHNLAFEDDEEWLMLLCKANPLLPLSREALLFEDDIHELALFMLIVFDYAQWANSDDEGLTMATIDRLFPDEYETFGMRSELRNGTHSLIEAGLIEHKCEDGTADTERYVLTRKCKEELLSDYTPSRSKCMRRRSTSRNLKQHGGIKEKQMFYNATEEEQITRLTSLLSQENLPDIQQRLEEEGMRKGFASLFFGAPGTGKTETVLQIARQTGRDIMQVDIAGMRDKYVGESEKNIKAVFAHYRRICKESKVMPILFFNEADAIFGKRTIVGGINPSVEKMDNAMQNIILQELEDLDGILIATTNLTCNLDSAFERRFLFKVEFQKPSIEVKAKLWRSMLGDGISESDALCLAMRYDFSGGQIENIARKRTIEYILSGKKANFEQIDEFCQHELLDKRSTMKPIGFQCA